MSEEGFGSLNRYYAGDFHNRSHRQSAFERDLKEILKKRGVYARVRQTVRDWNKPIRDLIRNETGLRLSTESNRQTVPVVIKDGFPLPLSDLLLDYRDPIMWRWVLNRCLFSRTLQGLEQIVLNLEDLRSWHYFKGTLIPQQSLEEARAFLAMLVDILNSFDLLEKCKLINEDILGAYFFRVPRVEVYWMVIGLFAPLLEVGEEDLTIVVLAHELAHAYSHLGYDIDGEQWKTEDFAKTNLSTVEGLAQFYAQNVCRRLNSRMIKALEAFEKLLSKQPPPYTRFQKWVEEDDRGGEVVRLCMLNCRTQGVTDYADFLEELEKARNSLGPASRRPGRN